MNSRGHPSPHAERELGLAGCSAFVETRFIASNRDGASFVSSCFLCEFFRCDESRLYKQPWSFIRRGFVSGCLLCEFFRRDESRLYKQPWSFIRRGFVSSCFLCEFLDAMNRVSTNSRGRS
jgi:hypothetical protein